MEKASAKVSGQEHFKRVSGMARGTMSLEQRVVGGFI